MPPVVIDIRSAEDSRDVVHRAVQALVEGKLVAFPTETVYCVAASALNEDAVRRLNAVKPDDRPLELGVKSADEALDYLPTMGKLGERLARRCWPGPVTLMLEDRCTDSLLSQLPNSVREVLCQDGTVSVRVPAHSVILETLRLLPGPIAITDAPGPEGEAHTALQVLEGLDDKVQLILDDGRSRYAQPASLVQVAGQNFELIRPGVVSEHTLRRLASLVVLFVCTGNTCRSPMAAAMFKQLIADRKGIKPAELPEHGVIVESAGIAAMMGSRPSAEAVTVMAEMGIDLTDHESQPLTERLARQADFIFAMTKAHRQAIINEWPEIAPRTRLVSPDWTDVADPIGGPPELYKRCAEQIKAALVSWLDEVGI
jgi:protein-tyrosine phosphatase